MEQTALVADLPGLSCGICFLRTRFGLTVAQRGNQLLRTEQPPPFPCILENWVCRQEARPSACGQELEAGLLGGNQTSLEDYSAVG